jgi:UDP-glucose 6-dehydrogenase
MHLSVIGNSYVGTINSSLFRRLGHPVVNTDLNGDVVDMINRGEATIHKDSLQNLVEVDTGEDIPFTVTGERAEGFLLDRALLDPA